ncbi:DUF2891 domain-containing protein [Robiginitalea sp. SC105]|uniref:DUF2891 domain-containing protein n=1 Tax=Robiginitalea sp. SC105 TaxID=2762332 RepID=UPI00163A5861|nr:DUF2891 domain-containing protein [Robiginitalea sp. SC105]MBC2840274.1 DUF2891 domain-containing protein [Robiginitalea sp. SC105]
MRISAFFLISFILILFVDCTPKKEQATDPESGATGADATGADATVAASSIEFTREQAEILITLPMACVGQEYPNKLGQTLTGPEELAEPRALHPAFYGCFDWHSAVHGHWSMVKLLKEFPDLAGADSVRQVLRRNISAGNILAELEYFKKEHEKGYERTYGWGWLLKLASELHSWDDPMARELEKNLRPLTGLISDKFVEYLPKLQYPVRVGTHTNTAFGLAFAWDYAQAVQDSALIGAIRERALAFYDSDRGCPITWEPSGADFLSPCLEEMDLMRRIKTREAFLAWTDQFLPELRQKDFALEPARVGDRSDGQLVHLDGLNFSRAWVFYGLAKQYPAAFGHLLPLANAHMAYSFPNLLGDGYEGGHWLGTFALYALGER